MFFEKRCNKLKQLEQTLRMIQDQRDLVTKEEHKLKLTLWAMKLDKQVRSVKIVLAVSREDNSEKIKSG